MLVGDKVWPVLLPRWVKYIAGGTPYVPYPDSTPVIYSNTLSYVVVLPALHTWCDGLSMDLCVSFCFYIYTLGSAE